MQQSNNPRLNEPYVLTDNHSQTNQFLGMGYYPSRGFFTSDWLEEGYLFQIAYLSGQHFYAGQTHPVLFDDHFVPFGWHADSPDIFSEVH